MIFSLPALDGDIPLLVPVKIVQHVLEQLISIQISSIDLCYLQGEIHLWDQK